MADAESQQDRDQDPQRPPDEGHPFHAQEIAERELDADGEHQEDDADLGEQLEGVHVGDGGPGREGADEDAPQDVPEDQRLAREPCQRPTEHGGGEDVGEIAEDEGIGDHDPAVARRATARTSVTQIGADLPAVMLGAAAGRATRTRLARADSSSGVLFERTPESRIANAVLPALERV